MRKRLNRLPAIFRAGKQKGVALIITLGIVALLLILVMSFAFDAQSTSQVSTIMNDSSAARLIARGGLERVTGMLSYELGDPANLADNADKLNPAVNFYSPGSGDWFGRSYLPSFSQGTAHDTGWIEGMHVAYSTTTGATVNFTPNSTLLVNGVSWDTIVVAKETSDGDGSTTTDMITGRVSYLLIDYTGAIDPAVVVNTDSDEDRPATQDAFVTRGGASMVDIQLTDVIDPSPPAAQTLVRQFHPTNNTTYPGALSATYPRWWSYSEIAKSGGSGLNQQKFDSVARNIYPFSTQEEEEFWVDVNNDSVCDPGELISRIAMDEIGSTVDTAALYDLLVGYDATNNVNRTQTSQYSPWLIGLDITNTDSARIAAARLALTMADAMDGDRIATYATINQTTGALTLGSYAGGSGAAGSSGNRTVYAMGETGPYLTDLAVAFDVRFAGGPNAWSCTPLFKAECTDFFNDGTIASVTVEVDYDFLFSSNTADALSGSGTATVLLADTTNGTGGATSSSPTSKIWRVATGSAWAPGTNVNMPVTDPLTTNWYVDNVTIQAVRVKYVVGATTYLHQSFPAHAETQRSYWLQWVDASGNAGDVVLTAQLTATDPMLGMSDQEDSDFSTYWTTDPGTATNDQPMGKVALLSTALQSYLGTAHSGYAGAAYGDVEPAPNAVFARIGEVGGLHHPTKLNQSVRLWAAVAGDLTSHDAYLLDMFYIDADVADQRGRININTNRSGILQALFKGVEDDLTNTNIDFSTAATATRAMNGSAGGSPRLYRGDLVRIYPSLVSAMGTLASSVDDNEAEDYITKMVELTTTRHNFYVVIVNGQSVKDLGQLSDATAANIGAIKWKDKSVDSVTNHSWMQVKGEQKLLAYIQRDAYTNELKILRVEVFE